MLLHVSTWYKFYLKNNGANILIRRVGRIIDVGQYVLKKTEVSSKPEFLFSLSKLHDPGQVSISMGLNSSIIKWGITIIFQSSFPAISFYDWNNVTGLENRLGKDEECKRDYPFGGIINQGHNVVIELNKLHF